MAHSYWWHHSWAPNIMTSTEEFGPFWSLCWIFKHFTTLFCARVKVRPQKLSLHSVATQVQLSSWKRFSFGWSLPAFVFFHFPGFCYCTILWITRPVAEGNPPESHDSRQYKHLHLLVPTNRPAFVFHVKQSEFQGHILSAGARIIFKSGAIFFYSF